MRFYNNMDYNTVCSARQPRQESFICEPSARRTWIESKAVAKFQGRDPVSKYIRQTCAIPIKEIPDDLRCHHWLRYYTRLADGSSVSNNSYFGMVVPLRLLEGSIVTLHRTYLFPDGRLADGITAQKLMPGYIPDGCAFRLGNVRDKMAVAVGVEEALRASVLLNMPAWGVHSPRALATVVLPLTVSEVVVVCGSNPNEKFFGDLLVRKLQLHGKTARMVFRAEGHNEMQMLVEEVRHEQ